MTANLQTVGVFAIVLALAIFGADRLLEFLGSRVARWLEWRRIKRDMARTCDRIERRRRS